MAARYTIQKCSAGQLLKFFGPTHAADDEHRTLCGIDIESDPSRWWIHTTDHDGSPTCARCKKQMHMPGIAMDV